MRTIPAGEFKAKCLSLMDEVEASGEPIVVTKRGKPVVRVAPLGAAVLENPAHDSIFGFMRGRGTAIGDIIGPVIPQEEWTLLNHEQESPAKS